MPNFWQFPTVSMGLGPMMAIYQARFLRYLENRELVAGLTARSGASSATARWTSRSRWARSRCRCARSSTTWCSSSTATCSVSTARCAATARSSRNSRPPSWARAGTSSRWSGARAGIRCWRATRRASCAAYGRVRRRRVPELQGQGRRVHARALLRQVSRSCNEMVANMSDDDIWRLNRGGHDSLKVCAAYAAAVNAQGPAHRDPRQDRQGLRPGQGRRGPEGRAPAEEAGRRGAQGLPRPLQHPAHRRGDREAPVLPAGRGQRGDEVPARAPQGARAAICRVRETRRPRLPCRRSPPSEPARRQRGSRDLHHHGLRAHPDAAAEGQEHRQAHRADRARRGAHLRHGRPVPPDRHLLARSASSTRRRTPTSSCTTARTRRARCSRRASTRPAPSARGWPRAPPTRTTAST